MLTELDLLELNPQPIESSLTKMLRFPLGLHDTALLPLEQILEIIKVNVAEILPIPEMPSCVLGIYNWRGEMLWMIDLNDLVGYPPLTVTANLVAIVVQENDQPLGLAVQRVDDIELHELQELQKAVIGLFPPSLQPFVLGAVSRDSTTVLDVTAITQCPLWQMHQK